MGHEGSRLIIYGKENPVSMEAGFFLADKITLRKS